MRHDRDPNPRIGAATFVTITIGLSTTFSVVTSKGEAGDYQSSNWAWGFGTMIGNYIAGGISGGHLNPAVSVMLCLTRGVSKVRICYYLIAQLLAGFFAGLTAHGIYMGATLHFSHGKLDATQGGTGPTAAWAEPKDWVQGQVKFFNEFVAAVFLGVAILALSDERNTLPGTGIRPLIIGLVITALSMAFGYNTGNALNPARDIGPRSAAWAIGYKGSEVWSTHDNWWIWGAVLPDFLGTLFGGCLYDVVCGRGLENLLDYPDERWSLGFEKPSAWAKKDKVIPLPVAAPDSPGDNQQATEMSIIQNPEQAQQVLENGPGTST